MRSGPELAREAAPEREVPVPLAEGETVASALAWAAHALERSGCPEARLDAELLLAHALGWGRTGLHAHPEKGLSATERLAYWQAVARRSRREPIAYILGHCEFYGADLEVSPAVLIPRPETEMLVELALDHLHRGARQGDEPTIVDVGTGSGAIAVALARTLPRARVYAIDISSAALQVAAANCRRHGVSHHVTLIQGDLLESLGCRVDCLVANLPYVREDEIDQLPPEVRDYEPRLALCGGPDGLAVVRRLLDQAPSRLAPGAAILLEIGAAQGEEAARAAVQALAQGGLRDARVELLRDYGGHNRVVVIRTA